jgi:hypothetical protein
MKRLTVVIGILVLVVALAYARAPKSDYQWTGSVVEVDNDHIIVQKGEEKWEFAHDKDTKMTGSPKAGSKVTIKYLMKATSIEIKEEAKKVEPKKK